jgi:hypothetical protein
VGHRTVALMIEQAVEKSAKRQRGLRAAVVVLSALLVVGLTVGGWFVYQASEEAPALEGFWLLRDLPDG